MNVENNEQYAYNTIADNSEILQVNETENR